ncbi:hypothetical protein HMN09_00985100 [Mycena chlorophos]|uniref:DUF323 domain-containing protein n=1 Tax=Mycena chlorophos TaxID=658473 RepID=A0A8H6W1R4_MYCCL|nr:hypothetical protein HMN09_00985100 [Mycena chlorophos]
MAAKKPEIINVHSGADADAALSVDMAGQVLAGLRAPAGQMKTLPTMLLYDERGLRLYDDITTHASEYYLFGAEEDILKRKADEIVAAMHRGTGGGAVDGEVVLELGAGALRKTSHILLALSRLVEDEHPVAAPITYYALDLEERELHRTLGSIADSEVGQSLSNRVETKGLCATYEQGLKFAQTGGLQARSSRLVRDSDTWKQLRDRDTSPMSSNSTNTASDSASDAATSPPSTPDETTTPVHLMFLGSSLGNFGRKDGADFLRSLPLRPGSGDTLLIGMDHANEKALIEEAYNDPRGYTAKFIMNGLKGAGRALGDETLFDEENWEYVNSYDITLRRHEAFFKARRAHTVVVPGSSKASITFLQNELVKIEESFKFSERDAYSLFAEAGLRPIQRWTDTSSRYSLWLLERPRFTFPPPASPLACNAAGELVPKKAYSSTPFGVPAPQDWENLWAAWDTITRRMIPPSMLFQKPIDLRHICLFYFGHIPTFLDIHLSRLLGEGHTEPEGFKYIFERGIDPDVDDPTQCHPHSEVPTADNEWPTLAAILQFQTRVRARLLNVYADIDSGKLVLNRKVARVLFMTYEHEALHAETLLYMLLQKTGSGAIGAGAGTLPPPEFVSPPWEALAEAWDAAPMPKEESVVIEGTSVVLGHDDIEAEDATTTATVDDARSHEFGWDNESPKHEVVVPTFRISWRPVTNGQFLAFYKAQNGSVPLPASWVESAEGEIQVRTFYGPVPMRIAQHWPVIAPYTSLSKYAIVQGGRLPTEAELRVFYDRFSSGYDGGANVGFRNWHPVPATTGVGGGEGQGGNGGVWEWTSTLFDKTHLPGFAPSALYPGYSADFFDGAHQVVLGGSYATIPRIAERRSFRNWYHHKYPYAWVGGRVVWEV